MNTTIPDPYVVIERDGHTLARCRVISGNDVVELPITSIEFEQDAKGSGGIVKLGVFGHRVVMVDTRV